ncbi:hypothetical protein REPUB_Repub01dG0241700 [Reevesia pubescens]
MEKQIAIIGAGISGLLAFKEQFPSQHKVLEYIEAYTHHFDLLRHIKFNTKVVSIDFEGPSDEEIRSWHLSKGKWNVVVDNTKNHSTESLPLGGSVTCQTFADFPPGKGPETFHGEVIHSMDYETAAKYIKGKRIVVVGLHNSAMDIAMECATANGVELPCTILYKNVRCNVPDYLPWGVPLAYLYLNHFSELLNHMPDEGFLYSLFIGNNSFTSKDKYGDSGYWFQRR